MDKQLIERIALEVAQAIVFPGFEIDDVMASALTKYANAFLARIDAERGKGAVAWFAFADNNGPVPLELWGFDQKACKHSVLENARSVGWKGTIEGYLLHMSWTIRPLFLSPPIPEGMALVPVEQKKDAERWQMVELLMFLGDVELNQAEDGGYEILLDPVENIVPQAWQGNSPEEAIDAAMLAAAQGERNAD